MDFLAIGALGVGIPLDSQKVMQNVSMIALHLSATYILNCGLEFSELQLPLLDVIQQPLQVE